MAIFFEEAPSRVERVQDIDPKGASAAVHTSQLLNSSVDEKH
jgi:hypothetical protein